MQPPVPTVTARLTNTPRAVTEADVIRLRNGECKGERIEQFC
jgi:hypothetical protein